MDLSEDFTLVRFAHWADGTQEYSDLFARAEQLGRQNDLQLSPSGRLVAAAVHEKKESNDEEEENESAGRKLVLLRTSTSGHQPDQVASSFPSSCDVFCWMSETRLLSASVDKNRQVLRVWIHQIDGERELGKEEDKKSFQRTKVEGNKDSKDRKYILNDSPGSFELVDCGSEFGKPIEIKLLSSDLSNHTCTLVLKNCNNSESVITFRSCRDWIQSYSVVHLDNLSVNAVCVQGQLLVAHVDPNLLYLWNLEYSAVIWYHTLAVESIRNLGTVNKIEFCFTPRDEFLIAAGTELGYITILKAVDSFCMRMRTRVANSIQKAQSKRFTHEIVVNSGYENLHKFHCCCRRIILPLFKGLYLSNLVFHSEKLLSIYNCRKSQKSCLLWSSSCPEARDSVEYSRAERIIELDRAIPLRISPDLLVFLDNLSLFFILPKEGGVKGAHPKDSYQYEVSIVEDFPLARAAATSAYSWLSDFLVASNIREVGNMIDLNGICRNEGEKLLLMLQVALQRIDINLLENLVPEIVRASSQSLNLCLSAARYLILEVIVYIFRYPSLQNIIIPKFAKFLIQLLKRASLSGRRLESKDLSKYLKILRGFDNTSTSREKTDKQHSNEDCWTEESSGPKDRFEILKAGLARNRLSEAVFQIISFGLDNFESSYGASSQSIDVKAIINSYIIHLVQNGSFDEVRESLTRLDICFRSVLENIFWSAFSKSIQKRAIENLHSARSLSDGILDAMKVIQTVEDAYKGKDTCTHLGNGDYASVMRYFSSESDEVFGIGNNSAPHLSFPISLEIMLEVEGVLGQAWPKRLRSRNIAGPSDNNVGTGIGLIPAVWVAEWSEESIQRILIEGKQLSSGSLSDTMLSEYWTSCLSYACEHDDIDLLLKTLSRVPQNATCSGHLKVRMNQRGVIELPMTVFTPMLPDGLSSLVQSQVSHLLAEHGAFHQLYWSSALELLAFCEKFIVKAKSKVNAEEIARIQSHLDTVSAIYCSVNKLPNLTLSYDRNSRNSSHVDDTLKNTDDLSWCSWLPIAQNAELSALSCALNTAIVCQLDVHTTDNRTIEAIDGIGNYLHSLPLLGFEPRESPGCKYFESSFWLNFKLELMGNSRLLEAYPTLSSFLHDLSDEALDSKSDRGGAPAEDESFIRVRNALFACSSQSSLLLSNFPSQLPQWTKKLIHLSTSVRQYPSNQKDMPEPSNVELKELFLRQERDVEKYIENEFFVLPYESSLNLKIQNHIMHGRSFASIYACLTSNETNSMIENGSAWEEIQANNDFVTLERTSYCSALSNFQDDTVVSSCVLILQLLSKDTYVLQLIVVVLRYIVLCIDSRLVREGIPFSSDSITDGYDFLTPIVHLICADIKKGLILTGTSSGIIQLHEIMSAMLGIVLSRKDSTDIQVGSGIIDAKVTTWVLLNALNEFYGFKKDDRYMVYLARENDWVNFLAESERHGYSLREVLTLSEFSNKEIKSHLERALQAGDHAELNVKEGQNVSEPPELFALVSDSEKMDSPGEFLMAACANWRWPFLAVLSSCYDDVPKVKCFQYWLGSTCISDPIQFSPERHEIPCLVSTLCARKCYLPLIRAGETFFPKSIFVTFMYYLHSFMQLRLKDAEEYLMQFKQMIDTQGPDLERDSWMREALIIALESSLSSEGSNDFIRNKTIDVFKKCEVLQHFPKIERVYVLYDLLGERKYSGFVSWNSVDEGSWQTVDPERPFLTVNLEAAALQLEEENRWREARLLYERCSLPTDDIILRHAERVLLDVQQNSFEIKVDIQKSWEDIHSLFIESQLPSRRAGDFFFMQFDERVSYSTVADNLFVLHLAYKWYQGTYNNSEPCCSAKFLEEIMFRGLICRHIIAFENQQEQIGNVAEDKWYIPSPSNDPDPSGADTSGASFMIGSLEHKTLIYYMNNNGTKGMGDTLLAMLFNSFVWYGEIGFVKKLASKLKEVKGIKFLEALVKILAEHGEDKKLKQTDALSSDCFRYLQELLMECEVPHGVIDAVTFCTENIPHEVGMEFAKRVSFSFKLSSLASLINPNLVLRSKPEDTLQLLLRQGPNLLPLAEDFVDIYSMSPSKVADVLVKSYFKGLLNVHRDVPEEASSNSYEPTYSTEEFDRCAFLCCEKVELGHALLNLILTKHHLPSEFEVEAIILAYQYYESAHAMNGVDVLTTLAFDRVSTYSSLGEFKSIVRMLNGIGESKMRQYAIDKLVTSDKLELLLKKRTSNDSKERTLSKRRNLKREILSSIYQTCTGDSPALNMALQHFNKTKLVAQGLVEQAEQILHHAPKADEDADLRAASLFSEASSIFQSIGCVMNAMQSASQARELTKVANLA